MLFEQDIMLSEGHIKLFGRDFKLLQQFILSCSNKILCCMEAYRDPPNVELQHS